MKSLLDSDQTGDHECVVSPVGSGVWFSPATSEVSVQRDLPNIKSLQGRWDEKISGQVCLEILQGELELLGCEI